MQRWGFENSSPVQKGAGNCCCSCGVLGEAGALVTVL